MPTENINAVNKTEYASPGFLIRFLEWTKLAQFLNTLRQITMELRQL